MSSTNLLPTPLSIVGNTLIQWITQSKPVTVLVNSKLVLINIWCKPYTNVSVSTKIWEPGSSFSKSG